MNKIRMGPHNWLFPQPTVLVAANVNGKPNAMTVGAVGIACVEPPMFSIALRHGRYTLIGIKQNMTFSVNTPSAEIAKETDYCGARTGAKVDKMKTCDFSVFYGKLGTAPLIEQCPVNQECRVMHILDLGSHSLIIGLVEETYIAESCLIDGHPDAGKIRPITTATMLSRQYHLVGEGVAQVGSIGKELRLKEQT